jgi:catechol 2,3-dioxygenase-like lactoylglutathione lyase family enzyme
VTSGIAEVSWTTSQTAPVRLGSGVGSLGITHRHRREEPVVLKDAKAYSGFAVDDLERAREFYGGTLGLEVGAPDEEMPLLSLHLAGGRDTLVYEKPGFEPATYTILNFQVPDVEAAVDALAARGVTFERYEGFDQDEKGIAHGPGPQIAWFTDPAGNILAVHEEM